MIKRAIDRVPDERLGSLADYVEFLKRPTIEKRLAAAEMDFRAGRGVHWRRAEI